MSETITLGNLVSKDIKGQIRDATHVAVINAKAGCRLSPGEKVWVYVSSDTSEVIAFNAKNLSWYRTWYKNIGVVDPFLITDVNPYENFWILLYPNIVTVIRHAWTHPDLPEFEEKKEGEPEEDEYDDDDDDWCKKSCS